MRECLLPTPPKSVPENALDMCALYTSVRIVGPSTSRLTLSVPLAEQVVLNRHRHETRLKELSWRFHSGSMWVGCYVCPLVYALN